VERIQFIGEANPTGCSVGNGIAKAWLFEGGRFYVVMPLQLPSSKITITINVLFI